MYLKVIVKYLKTFKVLNKVFSFSTGACMEDKLFPKTNSLLDGRAQPLADIEEFSLKIKVNFTYFSCLTPFLPMPLVTFLHKPLVHILTTTALGTSLTHFFLFVPFLSSYTLGTSPTHR